jgi:hypothetical protein
VFAFGVSYVFTSFSINNFDVTSSVIDTSSVEFLVSGLAFELGFCGTDLLVNFVCQPAAFLLDGAEQVFSIAQAKFTPDVDAVPLPAVGLLLLSGLAGVAALTRRKNRNAEDLCPEGHFRFLAFQRVRYCLMGAGLFRCPICLSM